MQFKTTILTPSGNYITPGGRCLYPALFTPSMPKGETDQSKASWQITLLFPRDADLSLLKKAVEETIDENVTAKARATTKVKTPFLATKDQPRFADYADEYPVMIRANAKKMRPDVIGPNKNRIEEADEADEVYSGRWARISVRPFFYDHPTGGKGVSLGLQNVQMLDHAESMAGGRVKAADEFEAVGSDLEDLS